MSFRFKVINELDNENILFKNLVLISFKVMVYVFFMGLGLRVKDLVLRVRNRVRVRG